VINYYYTVVYWPLFQDNRGKPYQKGESSLDFNAARDDGILLWQWHQLDHMQTICTLLQTDNHTSTPSLNFYMSDALPDAQLTVSEH